MNKLIVNIHVERKSKESSEYVLCPKLKEEMIVILFCHCPYFKDIIHDKKFPFNEYVSCRWKDNSNGIGQ